jgi:hypothetical protein
LNRLGFDAINLDTINLDTINLDGKRTRTPVRLQALRWGVRLDRR